MKLAYVTHQYFPHHIGGTEMFTRSLVLRAVAAGHEVLVLSCIERAVDSIEKLDSNTTEFEGAKLVEVDFNLSLMDSPSKAEYNNTFMKSVAARHLLNFAPDVVHVTHALRWSASLLSACEELGVPTVVSLSDYWFICPRTTLIDCSNKVCSGPTLPLKCVRCVMDLHKQPLTLQNVVAIESRPKFMFEQLKKASKIIALSTFQKEVFSKNGFPPERVDVLRHGLELEGFEDPQVELIDSDKGALSPVCIGFVGSLVRHKGLHVLLEAMKRIPKAQLELRIYGPISAENRYAQKLIEDSGSDQRIRFLGEVDPAELGAKMREFDAFAMPAIWYENEPLVVKAAQYLGIPTLLSNIGSLSDMIADGQTGRLIKPGCAKSWALALEQFSTEPMAKFPRPYVKNMDENAREFLKIYAQLASEVVHHANVSH